MTEASTTYQVGDEIDIDGTAIILSSRKSRTGIRWTWIAPATDDAGEAYLDSPEAAIAHARGKLTGPRCRCGRPATMNAATRPTCVDCYDRSAD